MTIDELLRCRECKGLLNDEGTCINCGLVNNELTIKQQTRAFSQDEIIKKKQEETPSRWGRETKIGIYKVSLKDYRKHELSNENKKLFNRLRNVNDYHTSDEKSLNAILIINNKLKENNSFTEQTLETALKIYSEAQHKNLVMGRSLNIVYTASICLATRINNEPRLISDIIKECGKSMSYTQTSIMILHKLTNSLKDIIKSDVLDTLGYELKRIRLEDYARTYCRRIDMPEDKINQAGKIIKKLTTNKTSSGSPAGIIAASIYYIIKKENLNDMEYDNMLKTLNKLTGKNYSEINQKNIKKYMGVSDVTLRKHYKRITELNI